MKEKYQKEVLPKLKKELKLSSDMAVPKVEKVVLNVGIGRILQSASNIKDFTEKIKEDIAKITGQSPVATKAKKSIASFKLREGQTVGLKTTLRGKRMYDFIDRLIHVALPRSRDFRGLDTSGVDQEGNLTIGIKEHTIFPEVSESSLNLGLEVTVVTNTSDKEKALKLFRYLGFPLKKQI